MPKIIPTQASVITAAEADALFSELNDARALVLAVSGGPDSTALMVLAARWRDARTRGPTLVAVTVDHGLRAESKREAADVARLAKKLGLAHRTLRWTGKKPKTGLPQAARHARYRLLADAARKAGALHVLTAHTRDDQAETVIIRLLRGSGITGLAAMQRETSLDVLSSSPSPLAGEGWGGGYAANSASTKLPPSRRASRDDLPRKGGGEEEANAAITLLRPLLDLPKARLIATLAAEAIPFADDPTNRDRQFTRARLRGLMPQLAQEGLDAGRLALLARRLKRADRAIEATVDRAKSELMLGLDSGPTKFAFEAAGFGQLPDEIGLRLIGRAIAAVGSGGPVELGKLEALKTALDAARNVGTGIRRSLAGAVVTLSGSKITVDKAPPRRPVRPKSLTKGRRTRAKPPKTR